MNRAERLQQFSQGQPPADEPLEVLCEDHNGTYALPFSCLHDGAVWRNARSGLELDANVAGWRAWTERR